MYCHNEIIQQVYLEAAQELYEHIADEVLQAKNQMNSPTQVDLAQLKKKLIEEGHLSPRKSFISAINHQDPLSPQVQLKRCIPCKNPSPSNLND